MCQRPGGLSDTWGKSVLMKEKRHKAKQGHRTPSQPRLESGSQGSRWEYLGCGVPGRHWESEWGTCAGREPNESSLNFNCAFRCVTLSGLLNLSELQSCPMK